MSIEECIDRYYEWLLQKVCAKRPFVIRNYKRLLNFLFTTEFQYSFPMDENRYNDGITLRYNFSLEEGERYSDVDRCIGNAPCTMLEMMIALSEKMESFMANTQEGDRTGQWFWSMIFCLGLSDQTDRMFDEDYVRNTLERFFRHGYEPNGQGGLFLIPETEKDLRKYEIWIQSQWYINHIIKNKKG